MKQPNDFDRLVAAYLKLYDVYKSLHRQFNKFAEISEFERTLRTKAYPGHLTPFEAMTMYEDAIRHAKKAIATKQNVTETTKELESVIAQITPYASARIRRKAGIEEDIITADLDAILNQTIAEMKEIGDSDDQIADFKALWNSMTKDQKMAFVQSKQNLAGYKYGNYAGYEEGNGWRQNYKRDNDGSSPYLDQLKAFLGK